MDGPNSTSGSIPSTSSHSTTTSTPPSQSQSGVSPLDGQRYTPESDNKPARTSIHMRTPRVQSDVLPKVNREKAVEQLKSAYKEHYAQAEAKRDQLDLAHSLKDIRHYLDNPALAKECTSYSILWIPDEGEPVSVIPPGSELNDRAKAAEIRGMLHNQLDKLDQKFTVSKLQQLEEDIGQQDGLMTLAAQQLQELGEPLPQLPPRERIVLLGGTSAKGAPVPPAATPLPETGQHTQEPAPVKQPENTEAPKPFPGKFELRFKKPEARPLSESLDQSEPKPLLVDLEENPEISKTREGNPTGTLQTGSPFDVPLFHAFNEESEQERTDQTPVPTPNPDPVPPNISRPRPKPSHPVPNTVGTVPTLLVDVEPPSDNAPKALYAVNYLPAGVDQQHADIFRSGNYLDDDPMASVNSGVPGLGLVGEEQEVERSAGINQRFSEELSHRGDITQYGTFHRDMLTNAEVDRPRYALEQELEQSPGLAACMALKADLNGKGKHAGTVIIDVFKDNHPGQSDTNQAMIYVVPPDGADYDDPQKYLADCEETAKRLTWSLHQYNLQIADEHGKGRFHHLKQIPTLRTCAFGAGASRHHGVSAREVADRIVRGINAQMARIEQSTSQTITHVEFEDGTAAVFSRSSVPAEFDTRAPVPSAPLSETAIKLGECSPTLGRELEAKMGQLANQALRSAHPTQVWTVNNHPVYNGPLHSSRKAMLSRAMTNFHRKHAQDTGQEFQDARYIPDSAIPAIELGVLSTKPIPHAVVNKAGSIGQYGIPHRKLLAENVPEAAADLIAKATTGYQSNPDTSLLDDILRDVELMESSRASPGFDISQLQTYKLYPGEDAREELKELCREYYSMLAKQGDLPPSQSKPGSDTSAQPFMLMEGKVPVSSGIQRTLNVDSRNFLEKQDDWYARQTSLLKKAGAGLSTQSAEVSLQFSDPLSLKLSPESELQTFGRLYNYTQDSE